MRHGFVTTMTTFTKYPTCMKDNRDYLARSSASSASNLSPQAIKISEVTNSPRGTIIWKSWIQGQPKANMKIYPPMP